MTAVSRKPVAEKRKATAAAGRRQVARQMTREQFIGQIDDMLATVAGSYLDFIALGAPEEAKEFGAFHGAARAAVVHMRTLHEFLVDLDAPSAPTRREDEVRDEP